MSDRYLGGFITTVPPDPDPALGNAAPGMWTMEQYFALQKQGKWPAYDPYFNQTVLSLHGNGANGAQNNTFLDSGTANSGSGFTITRNPTSGPNAPTQGTFSPFSAPDGRWSNYFDGSSYFTSSTALFNYTTANASTQTFTIEAWVYHTTRATPSQVYYSQSIAGKGDVYLNFGINGSGNLIFYHFDGTARSITGSSVIPLNTWTYVAVVVSGGTATIYVDGVSDGSGTWYGIATAGQNSTSYFGRPATNASALYFQGYVSNLRVSDNARSISVPTAPYTNDGNTVLLSEQSNRFVDNSTNGYALAVTGTPKVTPFSPFAPTAYDASVNGGSGYFGGTGLVYAPVTSELQMGTGEFTIEGWIYLNAVGSQYGVYSSISSGASNWTGCAIDITSDKVRGIIYTTSGALVGTVSHQTVLTAGQWYHFALVRASGVVKVYVDGVVSNTTLSTTTTLGQNGTAVGAYYVGTNNRPVNGYLADVRVVKGTAIDFASTGIPTAPLTNITNTKLLLNFTNAGIFDNTGKNNLETVADAQIDTTTKKFGTGSMEFDGTGDRAIAQFGNPNLLFKAGNWTVECWVYLNNTSGTQTVIHGQSDYANAANASYSMLVTGASAGDYFYGSSAVSLGAPGLSSGVWTHCAWVRNGSTISFYRDGTSITTANISTNAINDGTTNPMSIGSANNGNNALNGFIDDLRITKGVARYTSNFTPQTSQWQDQ